MFRRTAALAVLALALTGCSSGTPSPSTQPSLSPSRVESGSPSGPSGGDDPALAVYYDQTPDWSRCQGGDQCTKIKVPLDYAHPAGKKISLALVRVPATAGHPIGSLVVNPGGPGASGIQYAELATSYFDSQVLKNFDIVGFDPRGVGASTPVECLDTARTDRFVALDPDPDTAAEVRTFDDAMTALGKACQRRSGDLIAHVSTVEAAKDIDVIRSVLGEQKLNYFGASYGTYLGATYAGLFPKRVGRMVLDGVIDPSVSTLDMSLVQAHGFQVALQAYVANCVAKGSCYLGSTVAAGIATFNAFLADVDKKPLPTTSSRELTEGNAVLGIWATLYSRSSWSYLDLAMKAALGGNGNVLMLLSDSYTNRGPNGYRDNSLAALYAINCLDHDDPVPSSKITQYLPRFEKASSTFGRIFAYGMESCQDWPVQSGHAGVEIHARGAGPIILIGTTRDPATPLVWAESLARQIPSAILIKRNGDGHTGYHDGNSCVDNTVNAYLVSGTVPTKKEISC